MYPRRHALLRARLLGAAAGDHHVHPRVGLRRRPDEGRAAGMIQTRTLNAEAARADFPILGRRINGKPLVHLDSAATSQKPAVVIDTMDDHYRRYNRHRQLEGVRLLAITHQSNTLGTINPIKAVAEAAHRAGALVLVDGAQAVPHMPVDVQDLGVDFYAFSGHKMCGPTGIGVLWARRSLLESMPPFLGGGDMIKRVRLNEATWNDLPWKFEAGTPSVAEGIGLGAAVDYLTQFGMDRVRSHERTLVDYALEKLQEVPGITLYGPRDSELHGGAISFTLANIHPHDLATLVDREGIAVRAGHHCTQPLMDRLGVAATTRASFYI